MVDEEQSADDANASRNASLSGPTHITESTARLSATTCSFSYAACCCAARDHARNCSTSAPRKVIAALFFSGW